MSFQDEVHDAVVNVCRPLGVSVVRGPLLHGAPAKVTVQIRGDGDTCDVVLYSGAFSEANDALGEVVDCELIRLLSNPPYRLADQTRGVAFGNAYKVTRA